MTLNEYIENMEWIYVNARWEAYYELVIVPFLKICCTQHAKVVSIHATRKSGRKSSREHFIEKYSYLNSDGKRCGIPDYVIVPEDSTYEKPKSAIVVIEFKAPSGVKNNYVSIGIERYLDELKSQSNICDYIIFTDGITWFFGHKEEENLVWESKTFYLFNDDWNELKEKIAKFIDYAYKQEK